MCRKDDVIGFLASHLLSSVVGEDTTRNIDSNPLASNDELESPYSQQMELYAVSPEICSLLEKNLSWTKYDNQKIKWMFYTQKKYVPLCHKIFWYHEILNLGSEFCIIFWFNILLESVSFCYLSESKSNYVVKG